MTLLKLFYLKDAWLPGWNKNMAKKSFETVLKQLEEIVREMESGELTLEQAVKKYETGMAHTKYCLEILDKTEQKITQLTKAKNGNLESSLFEEDNEVL